MPGRLYLWQEPQGGWIDRTQSAKLAAAPVAPGDQLGASVATDGSTVVAGAPAAGGIGAVYVFTPPSGGWGDESQTATLTESNGVAGDALGSAVALNGSTIVAGADGAQSTGGAVAVFAEPTAGWSDENQAQTFIGAGGAALGTSVAFDGPQALAGAPGQAMNNTVAGAVIVLAPQPSTGPGGSGGSRPGGGGGSGGSGAGGGGGSGGSGSGPTAQVTGTLSGAVKGGHTGVIDTLSCHGAAGQTCTVTETLTVREALRQGKVSAVRSHALRGARPKVRHITVTLGARTVTLHAGATARVKVLLNRAGERLLAQFHQLPLTLTATLARDRTQVRVATRRLTLHSAPASKHRAHRRSRRH